MRTIKHYYPRAMLVFVSGFQGTPTKTTQQNTLVVSNLGNQKSVSSINCELTVRNAPGTFSATLLNTNKQFNYTDYPDTEIQAMYKHSIERKQITRKSTKSTKSKNYSTTPSTASGNYFEHKNYDEWLQEVNISLEDVTTGGRFNLIKLPGAKVYYWTFDYDGSVIAIDQDADVAKIQGTDTSITLTVGKEQRIYNIIRNNNSLFTTKYRDLIAQGVNQKQFNNGRCKIAAMDRVVIFMSERFTPTGHQPDLIRVFTGLVNNVEESYSEGKAVINVTGEDVTKYMKISLINVNPALQINKTSDVLQTTAGKQNITVWGDMFKGARAPQIIQACTYGASKGDKGLPHLTYNIEGIGTYDIPSSILPKDLSQFAYSQEDNTFVKIVTTVDSKTKAKKTKADFGEVLGGLFKKHSVHICDPYTNNKKLYGFRAYAETISDSWSFYQGDWKTKREIAWRTAEDTQFVFYADRYGEIWFHPPRFSNAWILNAPNPDIYIIDTESIISYGFVESDENIYTVAFMSTEPPLGMDGVTELGFYNKSYEEVGAVLKYGYRIYSGSTPLVNVSHEKTSHPAGWSPNHTADKSSESLIVYAKSLLQRLLASKYQGQITLTGRPEIDPGRPVYVPFKNMIYYVETVNHQFQVGGGYTTTIHLSYGRKPWEMLPELLTFDKYDEIYMTDASLYMNRKTPTDAESVAQVDPLTNTTVKR